MIDEHAITYRDKISDRDLEYLIKKANRLGKNMREIVRVFQKEDAEGIHIYFEVTSPRDHENNYPRRASFSS